MKQDMTIQNWTPEDEAKFSEMQVRRAIVMTERRKLVDSLVEKFLLRFNVIAETGSIVAWFCGNADEIRDALAPFDSDVRGKT